MSTPTFSYDKRPKPNERIEKNERGVRLKKYGGSGNKWPEDSKTQKYGESHDEAQRRHDQEQERAAEALRKLTE